MGNPHDTQIVLSFGSLEEFAGFVAIIRGIPLDDPKLVAELAKFKRTTNALSDALKQTAKP